MYYKHYGDTDMHVSAVGLGTMRYDDAAVSAGRLEECVEIPLYAYEKGINYFDTAPFYCQDKSEIITGMALSQLPRDKVYTAGGIPYPVKDGSSGFLPPVVRIESERISRAMRSAVSVF